MEGQHRGGAEPTAGAGCRPVRRSGKQPAPSPPTQGWMNQLHLYDPELFHPSLTHSVLATLDGATLKLSYPKSNIPRRATFEEEILDATFVSHRCYNLTDAKVSPAVPRTLPREQGALSL